MITDYQEKGEGYWGAGAYRNVFQIIFNAIKGNTKNSQNLYAGVTNWNIQYEASIQSADSHTYFPVTNAQAENIPVGCYVSVGYGGNNNGTVNNDRGQGTIHAYVDDVNVINKVALDDGANTAIYLDIPEESAFNTKPHVYTESFSAPIIYPLCTHGAVQPILFWGTMTARLYPTLMVSTHTGFRAVNTPWVVTLLRAIQLWIYSRILQKKFMLRRKAQRTLLPMLRSEALTRKSGPCLVRQQEITLTGGLAITD